MRALTWMVLAAMVLAILPAVAQEQGEAVEPPAVPDETLERMELFKQMGMKEDEALFFSILTSGDMDPAQMLLLMMMMGDKGGGGDDALGALLFMNALGGKKQAEQPVVLDRGKSLLIIDDGVLYVVNLETMEVDGSLVYVAGTKPDAGDTLAMLMPMLLRAKEKAQQTSCLSNLKQLCTAFLMYTADFDEALPGEQWVEDIEPYHHSNALLRCPSRPELPVAYAMNEKLLGAKLGDIQRPAETILVFESNLGGDSPVGFPVDVPEEGVHSGGINCGFVDGHAKCLRVEQAKELLEHDPF